LDPKNKITLVAGLSLVYIVINTLLIANEFYWLSLLPIVALVVVGYLYALDKIFLLIAFITPLAIDITNFGMPIGLSIPSEPLLILLLVVFIFKLFHDRFIDRAIITHPVSLALIAYITWMFVTVFTSHDIVVSAKWFVAKLWLIIPTYFFGIIVFKNLDNIPKFVWAYVLGLIPVIFFTISVHAANDFSDHAAHWAMSPFYNDHTAYGAILAMFIPVIFGFSISKEKSSQNKRLFTMIAFLILMVAIYLSISRAAWVSLVGAIGVLIMMRFKIKLSWVLAAATMLVVLFVSFQSQIIMKMEKNRQDSSDDFVEHVQSVSNIATDASNLERINRWNAALNLFAEKPIFGWGPGTYQFVYAPYQNVEDKTIISTNVGNKGTAHSEYLLILAEEGVLGLISLLAIFILIVTTALNTYWKATNLRARRLSLLLFLGLITFMAHAFFNNFLDTDKAAVPFWGFAAAIVAIDMYHQSKSVDSQE
jgi:O-antigen ligase